MQLPSSHTGTETFFLQNLHKKVGELEVLQQQGERYLRYLRRGAWFGVTHCNFNSAQLNELQFNAMSWSQLHGVVHGMISTQVLAPTQVTTFTKVPKYQSIKIPKYQSTKESKYQSSKVPKYQNTKWGAVEHCSIVHSRTARCAAQGYISWKVPFAISWRLNLYQNITANHWAVCSMAPYLKSHLPLIPQLVWYHHGAVQCQCDWPSVEISPPPRPPNLPPA